MIFQKTIKQVLSGLKSQTRRLVQPGDTSYDASGRIMSVYHNGRLRWHVGLEYSVQPGRDQPAAGRIQLKSIRKERVSEISGPDALAEGIEIVGKEYDARSGRSAIRYNAYNGGGSTYAPVQSYAGLWDSINGKRPGCAWADSPWVWVLEFELVKETIS